MTQRVTIDTMKTEKKKTGLASAQGLCRRRGLTMVSSPEYYRKSAGNLNLEISELFGLIDDETMTMSSWNCIVADTLSLTVHKI